MRPRNSMRTDWSGDDPAPSTRASAEDRLGQGARADRLPAGGALVRRAPFPRAHRMPPATFSPDWRTWSQALLARADDAAVPGVYAFDSGRSGLRFALQRLAEQDPARRQVVVPAYGCYSVAAAVEHAGLELVACDIDPRTLDLEPAGLEAAVGPQTLCIVVAHLFGCGVDTAHAGAVARRTGCHLIEDAAQADDPLKAPPRSADEGVTLRLVSTGRGKPLSTGGGGLVELHDRALQPAFDAAYARLPQRAGRADDAAQAARVALMKVLVHPRLFWIPAAVPGLHIGETIYPEAIAPRRMSRFQRRLHARLGARFECEHRLRRWHAEIYADFLRERATVPQVRALERPGYAPHRLPVFLARDRGDLAAPFAAAGRDGIAGVYPQPLPALRRVRRFCIRADTPIPGADWVARRLVTVPTHAHIDAVARRRVLTSLLELGV